MSGRAVRHHTIVAERVLAAPPERVFQAWADPHERQQWDVPGDDWVLAEFEQDFQVGGRERSRFGPQGSTFVVTEGRYLDIVENERIISAGVVYERDRPMTATLCTIELYPADDDTRLILTDQSAYFGSELPESRETGWGEILDRLSAHLRGSEHGRGSIASRS